MKAAQDIAPKNNPFIHIQKFLSEKSEQVQFDYLNLHKESIAKELGLMRAIQTKEVTALYKEYINNLNSLVYIILADRDIHTSFVRIKFHSTEALQAGLKLLFHMGAEAKGSERLFSSPLNLACLYESRATVQVIVDAIKQQLSRLSHDSELAADTYNKLITDALITSTFHQVSKEQEIGIAYEIAEYLLAEGASVNGRPDLIKAINRLPLQSATYNGLHALVVLLIAHGAEVDAKIYGGQTALHDAVGSVTRKATSRTKHQHISLEEKLRMIEHLLNMGADINALTDLNETALHFAAHECHAGLFRFLVEHGADVSIISKNGRTPLQEALYQIENNKPLLIGPNIEKQKECQRQREANVVEIQQICAELKPRVSKTKPLMQT